MHASSIQIAAQITRNEQKRERDNCFKCEKERLTHTPRSAMCENYTWMEETTADIIFVEVSRVNVHFSWKPSDAHNYNTQHINEIVHWMQRLESFLGACNIIDHSSETNINITARRKRKKNGWCLCWCLWVYVRMMEHDHLTICKSLNVIQSVQLHLIFKQLWLKMSLHGTMKCILNLFTEWI